MVSTGMSDNVITKNTLQRKKLLIIWVYYPAVGHLVEALEVAANYHAVHPNIEIHLLLNSKTPYQLAEYCDFIFKTHNIEIGIAASNNERIKALTLMGFDYVVFPKRLKYTPQDYPGNLLEINHYLKQVIQPKIWGGYSDTSSPDKQALSEKQYTPFKINIPKQKITFSPNYNNFSGPIFSVMLKGASKQTIWPTFKTWSTILLTIKKKYPKTTFLITGILSAHLAPKHDEAAIKAKISRFINSIPDAVNCYDIGLENQLSIIQNSDIFISPHTGFAFLSPCLDTPWLELSGGEWARTMPARIPFYSVLPNCSHYPCSNGDKKPECKLRIKLKQPIKCMANLTDKTSDILKGIDKLLNKKYTFEAAFQDYEKSALENKVNLNKLWRIDKYKRDINLSES